MIRNARLAARGNFSSVPRFGKEPRVNFPESSTALLAAPPLVRGHAHRAHVVQFYTEDAAFLDTWGRSIRSTLKEGGAVVVIATKDHRNGLARWLTGRGVNVPDAVKRGRYLALDAAQTLSRFVVEGWPDALRFAEVVGSAIAQSAAAAAAGNPRVAAFGEMVALLWEQGQGEAAIRLEQLWNDLGRLQEFSLHCAYPISGFCGNKRDELFLRVCAEHSDVVADGDINMPMSEEERRSNIARLQRQSEAVAELLRTTEELRQSEERFRLIVQDVKDYAIFMLDPRGHIMSWNLGAERIKGYSAAEIQGKHFSIFYPAEDLRAGKPEWELKVAAAEGRFEDEGWRLRKDGSRFWANVIITALRDARGHLRGFSKVTRDITERQKAREALQKANAELEQQVAEKTEAQRRLLESENSLRELSHHLLRTQDEERRRIGRELHDSAGQFLAMLRLNLELLESSAGKEETDRKLADCVRLADESIKEIRTISYLLYPPMLEEIGLKSAIPWYLEGFAKRSGIRTTFEISADFARLPREVELALFRVLQESLTNVHRHSGSPTAEVHVMLKDGAAVLEIKDQGEGISPWPPAESREDWLGVVGVGLRGMNERMRQLGGKLELSSSAEGTTVRATVPIRESEETSSGVESA
jgi:PAS domain S-box-containing protein